MTVPRSNQRDLYHCNESKVPVAEYAGKRGTWCHVNVSTSLMCLTFQLNNTKSHILTWCMSICDNFQSRWFFKKFHLRCSAFWTCHVDFQHYAVGLSILSGVCATACCVEWEHNRMKWGAISQEHCWTIYELPDPNYFAIYSKYIKCS